MTDATLLIVTTTLATLISSLLAIVTIVVNKRLAIIERRAATDEIIREAHAEAEALLIATQAKEKALKLHLEAAAERIRLETIRVAAEVKEDNRASTTALANQIAEVKQVATDAFHQANGVKMLLSQDKKEASEETGKKLDDLQTTANEIKEKVDDL